MEKFRIISDLHLDVGMNVRYPLSLDDGIFTVIAGDTSGSTRETAEWIRSNVRRGVGVSGNHLVYNDSLRTVQDLREELAREFPAGADFTYLDCETGTFAKEVDGVLFAGTCMYTDMRVSHPVWNPDGDPNANAAYSLYNMNDYRFGVKSLVPGPDGRTKAVGITPYDYMEWFANAFGKIDRLLDENEKLPSPRPVVLVTHYPLVVDFLERSSYIETRMFRRNEFNWASYASNRLGWLVRHPSVRCHCCGHIHGIYGRYRNFTVHRPDGSRLLVVNNARGYLSESHDAEFNPNRFVNVGTWEVEEDPLPEQEVAARKERADLALMRMSWLV